LPDYIEQPLRRDLERFALGDVDRDAGRSQLGFLQRQPRSRDAPGGERAAVSRIAKLKSEPCAR
jgi:hypothetical protein